MATSGLQFIKCFSFIRRRPSFNKCISNSPLPKAYNSQNCSKLPNRINCPILLSPNNKQATQIKEEEEENINKQLTYTLSIMYNHNQSEVGISV